jgi:transposase
MPSPVDVGVDVAKNELQIAYADRTAIPAPMANERKVIRAWLARLPAGSRIAMEASGGYHTLLADLAHAQGLVVYVVNPADLRHYARAVGVRGKTDRVDAAVIARFLQREGAALHPYSPPTPEQREIDALLRRRATVVSNKTQLRLSLGGVPGLHDELQAAIRHVDAIITKIDRRLRELATTSAPAHTRVESVLGIGPLLGVALANLFTRVPLRNSDAVVAFVGLDPRAKDSGQATGRRRLSKRGSAELRRLLFNGARSASKSKLWHPLYQQCLARGLSRTEATVIIARKLLRIAFSIYRHDTTFDPSRIAHA